MTEQEINIIKTVSLEDTFKLINIAVSTAKIQKLNTPFSPIRPSLHLILCGKIGSLKSSILIEICNKLKLIPTFNLTSASIMGTIDKTTGELIPPAIWDCRNSVLPIDEFFIDEHSTSQMNALRSMLLALEMQPIMKRIAMRCNPKNENKGNCKLIVKNGSITIHTRFVLIANTMHELNRKQRMIEMEALKSRCLIIPYYPTTEEIIAMLRKEIYFKYTPFQVNKICKIDLGNYDFIENLVSKNIKDSNNIARTIGDLCRICAVIGRDESLFNTIIKIKNYTHYD